MTLDELAGVTGGTVHHGSGDIVVTAPATVDSRQVQPGGLFVAVAGEHVDGHAFAAAAVRSGGAAVLAVHPVGVPAVVVDDVTAGLGKIATAVRRRLVDADVIAITGSAGKTTVKDLVLALIGSDGSTIATPGNFNNELGLPLTITGADRGTRRLVLEMGARHVGDIASLAAIARPTIGAVLVVGSAHLDEFGGVEAIAQGKGELVEALDASGTAVLNADDPRVAAMARRTTAPVVSFGRSRRADVRAEAVTLDERGRARFRLHVGHRQAPVRLRLTGEHQVANALAASAIAHACGRSIDQIAAALSAARPATPARMQVLHAGDMTIVNDAYNCNPDSARAALDALAWMSHGRAIAVLGPMQELGDAAESEHRRLGEHVADLGLDHLLVVGADHTEQIVAAAGARGVACTPCPDREDALVALMLLLAPGDTVLVKGARVSELDRLAESLVAALRDAGATRVVSRSPAAPS